MSLYHEASQVLEAARKHGGSIKSHLFSKKTWKSDSKALFALSTEASKWSEVLSEVIEKSGILNIEKQLSPILALVLTHDLLLSKKGLALPKAHGLATTITRHKARLAAELTKARIRRGFASLEALRADINGQSSSVTEQNGATNPGTMHPRWIRINTLRTSLDEQFKTTFADFTRIYDLRGVGSSGGKVKLLYIDENVPNLIAVPLGFDIISEMAYKGGKLILQDKASCFPALLLDPGSVAGDVIDACAAPGNKTTHLAALLNPIDADTTATPSNRKIFACERDPLRSQTLAKMVKLAGADGTVHIKPKQDFMKLNPQSKEFAEVSRILLDPSCSGSGIVGRDEVTLKIHLPDALNGAENASKGNKRKRGARANEHEPGVDIQANTEVEEAPIELNESVTKLQARLVALSIFQLRLLQHAMAFPAARRITYSTCSVYNAENEHVVVKALLSDIAKDRGWRILKRSEQVAGLQTWKKRGKVAAMKEFLSEATGNQHSFDVKDIADACIRCEKKSDDGTMGFFVAGFVRDSQQNGNEVDLATNYNTPGPDLEGDEDEWKGFSDDDP